MPRMRRTTVSLDDATSDAVQAEALKLGIPEAMVVRMRLRLSYGIERGAAGIDDASHATGTVRAARRSPRRSA